MLLHSHQQDDEVKQEKWLRSPVVHLLGCREALYGPVEEAVHEDEAGETRPHPHDHLEGHACIVDQLRERGRERRR